MTRSRHIQEAWTFGLNCLILSLSTACNSSDFSGSGKKQEKTPDAPALPAAQQSTETFTLDASKRVPVDLVWTIDNSGSMADNIEQVRKNFDAFMNSLSSSVDVRVILISASNGSLGLKLPTSASAGTQIEVSVGSHDAALIAAVATCPTSPAGGSICGVASNTLAPRFNTIAGKAAALFRPEAMRSYVFVTDDDSTLFSGKAFVDVLNASKGKAQSKVYSFRGINMASGCDIARIGAQYQVMESATAGKAFDICMADWSPSFNELAASITEAADPVVNIKSSPNPQSVKVFVDGKELAASEYTLKGQSITLNSAPDLKISHEVRVTYLPASASPVSPIK